MTIDAEKKDEYGAEQNYTAPAGKMRVEISQLLLALIIVLKLLFHINGLLTRTFLNTINCAPFYPSPWFCLLLLFETFSWSGTLKQKIELQ